MPSFTRDSLVNLRELYDRKQAERKNTTKRKETVPYDDLKAQASAKRIRLLSTSSKTVRFNEEMNTINERSISEDDLKNAWYSKSEQSLIKSNMVQAIVDFRFGRMNPGNDTMRGLEYRSTDGMSKHKVQSNKKLVVMVLEQQKLLQGLMGRANDLVLSRLSESLSAPDTRDAELLGAHDAAEARKIHETCA